MNRFPDDFAQLLSAKGRKLLSGEGPHVGALSRGNFLAAQGLLDAKKSAKVAKLLEANFEEHLVLLSRRLPRPQDAGAKTAGELLPKVACMLSTPMPAKPGTPIFKAQTDSGLDAAFRSPALKQFVEQLAGEPLSGPVTLQVLCYRPGDYAGPHTDYHPEDPLARDGYVDVHFTFCTPGVDEQFIVYENNGHLDQLQSIVGVGGVTAYRLPFWHYTTPLQAKPGARRWLVLTSFLRAAH